MSRRRSSWFDDLAHAGCGFLMGSVDVIPGVSGGTMALILGIYERLVTAISHVDLKLWGQVRRGRFRDAAEHLDLRFLVPLGLGIAVALVTLASLMKYLLEHQRGPTYGAFFGLIAASTFLVGKMIRRRSALVFAAGVVGAIAAYWLTRPESGGTILPFGPDDVGEPFYAFICGAIAICAMILPGISGSYLLVLLGKYEWVIGILHGLKKGDVTSEDLLLLSVFAAGCLIGILAFSKFLRWLLERFHDPTLGLLCGFMLGSLRKLWPFKNAADYNRLPHGFDEAWLPIALAAGGAAIVLALALTASRVRVRRLEE
ncbi:MAG: DUF368 domain-containing protein [Planctomycetes bacterium]|nr:DUF368 domain-containing protein [Planctomycetota bacterium]